ncbi:hypothetical protein CSAL01_10463 [Colletotrichum salicis]|uniref:Uncharacterized protein n=1 Tax=Colletotrichum salicis TaxID=1209931 RepID=A0A135UXR3_9PEZI|nr:hypothetical protein CSAL01_10463 [Colletotrichum salicis]
MTIVTAVTPTASMTDSKADRPMIQGVPLFIIILAIAIAVPVLAFSCFLWLHSRDRENAKEQVPTDQSASLPYNVSEPQTYQMGDIGLATTAPFSSAIETAIAELPDKEWFVGRNDGSTSNEQDSPHVRPNLDATPAEVTQRKSYVQHAVETTKTTTHLAVWFAPSTVIISEARKTLGYFTAWNVRSVTTTMTGTSWQFVAVACTIALSEIPPDES